MVKLFTGHCCTEGLLEGQTFVNESDFGAFPIQVQGHTHLHDSLEAACVNSEMGQEVHAGQYIYHILHTANIHYPTYTYMYMYMYMHVLLYTCTYMYMYVHV